MGSTDRDILRLAVPALGALVAEPLFLIADSALVGHLGGVPLAGLALASAVLTTITGLMVFLAYGTTPAVARRLGAGERRAAIEAGIDGTWLGAGLGVVLAVAGWFAAEPLVSAFGADGEVAAQASVYLRLSMLGLPAMLIVFAATGLLRGLQNTRMPLLVAVGGFALNGVLNAVLIYGFGLGIAGSALGTVVAQWAMVAVYLVVIARGALREGARVLPHHAGVLRLAGTGWWLFLRTASMRGAILLATVAATRLGADSLAAFQVSMTLYNLLAFALDALAIAAQALIGRGLGAGDLEQVRAVLRRCLRWGVGGGAVLGAVALAASPWLGYVFTTDAAVLAVLPASLALVAVATPLGGYVFVLDGVLIGAGDAKYLAVTGLLNLLTFAPFAVLVAVFGGPGWGGIAALMAAFMLAFLGARAVTLGLRSRSAAWQVVGAR